MNQQVLDQALQRSLEAIKQVESDPVTVYLNGLAPSGRRSMRSLLRTAANILGFEGPLEAMPWGLLRYPHVAKIRSELIDKKKRVNSINTTLAAIRGVLRAAFHLGQIPAAEWLQIDAVKRVRGKALPAGRGLSRGEVRTLFAKCGRDKSVTGVRDAAIIALMLLAGLRRSEVVGLLVKDYSARSGRLLIREGKGRRQREMVLTNGARKKVTAWLGVCGKSEGPLFCPVSKSGQIRIRELSTQGVYDIVVKRSGDAGFKCSPHDLRRTFVTRLLEQGVDINMVRQLAGHQNVQTTALYDRREKKARERVMRRLKG